MEIFLLCIAPFIGLLIGLLPAIGSFVTMISFYSILLSVEPNVAIYFYVMLFCASQFSGSVAAIWFGTLGEPTSIPIIKEREYIVKNNLQYVSLKNTSYSSVFAVLLSTIALIIFVCLSANAKWLFRTEVKFALACLVLLFCIFWPYNKWYENLFLILFGLFLGTIGYDQFTEIDFLTFNNPYLYGGLPFLTVLLGLYSIPMIIKIITNNQKIEASNHIIKSTLYSFSIIAAVRGSIIGFVVGLIPMIGATICSNVAHFIERFFSKSETDKNVLRRITSAEAANNSAVISLMIPLLVLGLPIQPSEIILYDIISINNWHVGLVTSTMILHLAICILFTTVICHIVCWHVVVQFADLFYRYQTFLVVGVITAICLNVIYIGYQSYQVYFHLIIFVIMIILGLTLTKKYDILPTLMAFMMQSHFMTAINILLTKYF